MTHSNKRGGFDRRELLKYSAATGAALAAGSVAAPAIAQAKTIKLGYVRDESDRTGPTRNGR